jgi:uncharacterized protein (TIGR00288 family)
MANDSNRPDVAVFIDFENVYVSVRDKLDANPNFESIMDRCEDFGRVVIARAYADWYRYPRVTSALYANSIEPIYVPTYYYDREMGRTGRAIKNSVDMNLCIDAMKTLFTHTNIAKFVLATGDRDFIPLVNSIRQQGKEVIIIGVSGAASSHLAQSADEFIFYETLVGKKPGELDRDHPRERALERGRDQQEAEGPPREREKEPAVPSDVYDVLVRAIHLARERGYVCSFGSLKLLMKELMGGEFKESRYKDVSGKPFAKFKDFVLEAERRGKVQVFTSGTVNEVFLPGEDPYKLSQFAQDLKEEPSLEAPAPEPVSESRGSLTNGRRRRRRTRGGQRHAAPQPDEMQPAEEPIDGEVTEELEEFEYLPPAEPLIGDLSDREQAEAALEAWLAFGEQEQASPPPSVSGWLETFEAADEPAEATELPADEEPGRGESAASAPAEITAPFSEDEWRLLQEIVAQFERPVSFAQIHNALRDARNSAGISRTNEELRTLIKQGINAGLLERSGKGNHIVYRLGRQAAETAQPAEGQAPTPGQEAVAAPDQVEPIAPASEQPEFYTPEAAAQAALAAIEPEVSEPPSAVTAEESSFVEAAPAKRSRARRKRPAAPANAAPVPAAEAPIEATPAKPKRARSRKAEPVAEATAVGGTPAEPPAGRQRTRRKKAETKV